MGTIIYNVKFSDADIEKSEVDSILVAFNQSLSTYIPDSEISLLNTNRSIKFRAPYFYPVLTRSQGVYLATDGAFDPTVGSLVKAWGFGSEKKTSDLDSAYVDSLRNFCGFDKIRFSQDSAHLPPGHQLDFSAIAKGYAVDIIGEFLEKRGAINYLVEIGGEVRCRGVNDQGMFWSLGIEDPLVEQNEQKLLAIVRLKDRALATSGNYRNYYRKNGRLYAHIIDPRTGYTANHNLLSASVFANDCMTADAYATAFMVLGLERSIELLENIPGLDGVLIYLDEQGELKSYISENMRPFIKLNKEN